jgi:hypothetical protein
MATRVRERDRFGMRFARAVAVLVFIGGSAACYRAPAPPPDKSVVHTVKIEFSGDCPKAVKPDSLRVYPRDEVLFRATVNDVPARDKTFLLQFDPMQGAPRRSILGEKQLPVDFSGTAGKTKKFTYMVLSGNCAPLDPEIIVSW